MSTERRAVAAIKWLGASQLAVRLTSWLITLLVMRYLQPHDYGLMASAVVLIEFAAVFSDVGLGAALIQRRQLDERVVARIYGVILLIALALFVVTQLAAHSYAQFYRFEGVEPVVRALAWGLLISAAASVPVALLAREIDFRALAMIDVMRTIVASVLVLTLAIKGFGVWSLVAGSLVSSTVHTVGILWVTGLRLVPSFNLTGIAEHFNFGAKVLAKDVLSAVNRQLDVMVVGRILGASALGAYSAGADLAKTPTRALLRPLQRVTFPLVSRLQDAPELIERTFVRMLSLALLVLLPLSWGLAAVAHEVIELLLGAKWLSAAPVVAIIGLAMPFRAVFRLLQASLDGIGRPGMGLVNHLTTAVVLPPAILLGSHWGLIGVAWGWVAAHLLATAINFNRSLTLVSLTRGRLLRCMAPPLGAAALMLLAVQLTRAVLPITWPMPARLALLCLCAAAVYTAATLVLNRAALTDLWRLARR